MVPKEILPPEITLNPPYQTNKPMVTDEEISATGKKMELNQTVFNHAFLCFSLMATNWSYSIFSLWKI